MIIPNYKGDFCFIKSPSDLFYFTGYENADAVLIFADGEKRYFTDSRYFEEVACLRDGFVIDDVQNLGSFLAARHFRSASVESSLSYADFVFLKENGIEDFFLADAEISALRAVKSPRELALMTRAQEITDAAFTSVLGELREGMSERELASAAEASLFKLGADSLAFTSIVAFGSNTSRPHAHRSDTVLKRGMPVTLDFGAKFSGYCSDMTRTVFFGEPSEEIKEIYRVVLQAQERALERLRAGMTGRECDDLARGFFREKGLDAYFIHSLGHSLGIDCHETPSFSPKCADIIKKGMTMSVEPGLYFEGRFGVRIEDVIYFDETGIRNLTKSPKNMIIL